MLYLGKGTVYERSFYSHVLANPVRYNYLRTEVLTIYRAILL